MVGRPAGLTPGRAVTITSLILDDNVLAVMYRHLLLLQDVTRDLRHAPAAAAAAAAAAAFARMMMTMMMHNSPRFIPLFD